MESSTESDDVVVDIVAQSAMEIIEENNEGVAEGNDVAKGNDVAEMLEAEEMVVDVAPGQEPPEVAQEEGTDSVVAFECHESIDDDDDDDGAIQQEDPDNNPPLQALDLRLIDPETGGEVAKDEVKAEITKDAENTEDVTDHAALETSAVRLETACTPADVQTEDEEMVKTPEHQQEEASEEEDTEEVMFVCVHGQTFRCKPQVGTPIKGSAKKSLHTEGSCSCGKSHGSSDNEVQGGDGDKNQKFICGECGGRFTQKASLERHMIAHVEEEKSAAQAETHGSDAERKPKKWKVKMSPRTTRRQKQSIWSEATEDNICQECGKVFKRKTALAMHIKQHDKEKVKKSEAKEGKKKEKKEYQCKICGAVFPSKYKLDRHGKVHGKEIASFTCDDCPKVFNRLRKLQQHKKEHPKKTENSEIDLESLTCKECFKVFCNPSQLKRHELLHVKEENIVFNCATCSEEFEDKFSFKAHMKIHAMKRIYRDMKCEICEKVVKGPATMRRHMRTHTKERPFACRNGCNSFFPSTSYRISHERLHCKMNEPCLCTHCGQVFGNKGKLMGHEAKVHPDVLDEQGNPIKRKEYPCRICGRVFSFSAVRKRHERIHTNEKPYMCQYCPKAFSHHNSLICHERVHTKERPYKCEVCGKDFSQASHCKTHMRIHTREKPYSCRICSKTFAHIGTRKAHENCHLKPDKKTNPVYGVALEGTAEVQEDTNLEIQESETQESEIQQQIPQQVYQEIHVSEDAVLDQEFQGQEVTIQGDGVTHRIILQHPEHELQAADVILQLIERGSRVSNLEGMVQIVPK